MTKNEYKYLFGPVPSRRLGISLGVDLVPPKTCSLNCIYCECGSTTDLTTQRKEYVPTKLVITELTHFLNTRPELDYITFSGAGEPTLHSGIGKIIKYLKDHFPAYQIALLTNGTLFYQPDLIEEVKAIDLILPSLDAASDQIFRKLNRPAHNLKIQTIIDGLVELRSKYSGQIWLEIFIVQGLNDSDAEIDLLKNAVHRIKPDKVQLNTLDRPGTEHWVTPTNQLVLQKIAQRLDWKVEIIATFQERETISSYNTNIENAIIQTIKRRPCTVSDLASALGLHFNEINKYVETLLRQKKIKSVRMARGLFFKWIN